VRAKVPVDQGTWPAIWLLGKNINEDGAYFDLQGFGTTPWPACNEIDIMEHGIFPSKPQDFIQVLFTHRHLLGMINHGGILASDLQNNYHIYSMNWSPYKISFLLDGVIFYT
jgi:beta-glucanase (GH16 family)